MALLTKTDGIFEHTVSDGARGIDGITTLADANLARFALPSVSGGYDTWNDARAGMFVPVTYPTRKLWGRFQIQQVTTQFKFAPDYISRNVSFTDTLLLTFNDLLNAAARKRKNR
jgi:hypothetical protein